ncbi:DUF7548 family protein [Haloarchaeobius sp. TZWWS8]|uniref:DUF7548 family protein n=1 Tax=Haloarchaeobius sp. TZWWS8 TaxID=3446121 RepID=UPI003EC04F5C
MVDVRTPPTAGIVAALALVAAVFAPYVALSASGVSALGTYYGYGLVGPPYIALFALVAAIVFAAGREGRTEPDLAAGVTLVLGFAVVALVFVWAVSVSSEFVSSIGTETWMAYHRWAVLLVGVVLAACGVWYARVLGLLTA